MDLGIEAVRGLVQADSGLAVVATAREDGGLQASVVNAGVLRHPGTGVPVVGFVARASTVKVANLRARPQAAVTFRAGWRWVTAEGTAELAGPDDPHPQVGDVPALLRAVFTAAGGTHDDWATYDRVMADERRTAVLVLPDRIYGNP
jgi:PPOX class probable F420-dependent enzyme